MTCTLTLRHSCECIHFSEMAALQSLCAATLRGFEGNLRLVMRVEDPTEYVQKLLGPDWTASETFERTRYVCDSSPLDPAGPGLIEWDGKSWTRESRSPNIRVEDGVIRAVRETPCLPSSSEYRSVDFKRGTTCFYEGSGGVIWSFELYEHREGRTPALTMTASPTFLFALTAMTTQVVKSDWLAERFILRASQFINRELRLAPGGPTLHFPPPSYVPFEPGAVRTAADAIAMLYRTDRHQCRQCGVRLPEEAVAAHMDAHFARNRTRKVRTWYHTKREFATASEPEVKVIAKSTIRCVVCDHGFHPVRFDDGWVYDGTVSWQGYTVHDACAQYLRN